MNLSPRTYIRISIQFVKRHKVTAVFILLLLCVGGYGLVKALGTSSDTLYVLSRVEKKTLVSSITGSGQVSASNQFEIKSKVSGDVLFVGVTGGREVKRGTVVAQLDARDMQKAVRDAEVNVQTSELSLEKLKQPADALSLMQAENALLKSKESKQSAEEALLKAYDDALTAVSNTFLDIPTHMAGLQDMLYKSAHELGSSSGLWNVDFYSNAIGELNTHATEFRDLVNEKYTAARTAYEINVLDYKNATRFSNQAAIESLLNETYETSRKIAEAIKSANNLIQLYKDELGKNNLTPSTFADTHLSLLNQYTGEVNGHLSSILSILNAIENSKDTIQSALRSISESETSLLRIKKGTDELDIRSGTLSLAQRQNALADAKENLSNYFIRVPFEGTIARVTVKKGDSVSAGTALAILLTTEKFAEISLNEVDAAKVNVGQKATLTFDAIEGLTLSGKVSEIDAIGTVSQGVVTYAIKIGFDTADARVKSGMSVSAAIITAVKQDVLSIQNSALKSRGTGFYVEMLSDISGEAINGSTVAFTTGVAAKVPPIERSVETGVSNDTDTEIVSGLSEDDAIVVRTIAGAKTNTGSQAPSILNAARGAGGGSGNFRALR